MQMSMSKCKYALFYLRGKFWGHPAARPEGYTPRGTVPKLENPVNPSRSKIQGNPILLLMYV